MNEKEQARKDLVIGRVLFFVSEYYTVRKEPVPLKVLSSKYARSLMHLGGFPEIIEDLRKRGLLQVFLVRSGSKLVLPSSVREATIPVDAIRI